MLSDFSGNLKYGRISPKICIKCGSAERSCLLGSGHAYWAVVSLFKRLASSDWTDSVQTVRFKDKAPLPLQAGSLHHLAHL